MIFGLARESDNMREHSLVPSDPSTWSPVIPNGLDYAGRATPALVFFAPDLIIGEQNPYQIIWAHMADHAAFAIPRIMMRGLLSNSCPCLPAIDASK